MKKVFLKYWPFLVIFFASLYPFYLNSTASDSFGMFNLRDSNTPFDPASDLKSMFYVWQPNWGLGYPNFGSYLILVYHLPLFFLRVVLGFNLMEMVKAYLTAILFLLGIGAYFFLTRIFVIKETQNKKIAGVLGTLFYMFNIPSSQRFIGVPHTAVSVALFPLILLLVDRLIFSFSYRKTIIYSLLLALLSVFFYGSDPSLAYLFSLFIFVYIILILFFKKKCINLKNILLGFFLTLVFSFSLNLYWILPSFNSPLKKSFLDNTAGASYNIDTFERSANTVNSPLEIIRLHWTKNSFEVVNAEGDNYYPPAIGDYYRLPFSYFAFFILLALGLKASFQNLENRKTVLVITVMGILSLMFSFGRHAPFGFWAVHRWLFFNFPGFSVLRTFSKFQFVVILWYIVLFYFLGLFLLDRLKKTVSKTAVSVFLFIFFIFQTALPWFWPNLAGRLEYFNLPPYYQQVKNFFSSEIENFRFFVYPQGRWEETYDWGPKFELVPLYRNYFKSPSLYVEPVDATGTKDFVLPVEEHSVKNLGDYLGFLNVKYVLLRKDLRKLDLMTDLLAEESFENYLKINNYSLTSNYDDKLSIYQLKENVFSYPLVYIPEQISYFKGNSNKYHHYFGDKRNSDLQALVETDYFNDYAGEFWIEKFPDNSKEIDCLVSYFQLQKKPSKNSSVFVKHKPGSFFYNLALFKEKIEVNKLNNDRYNQAEKLLYFAGKRINELVKFWPLNRKTAEGIRQDYNSKILLVSQAIKKSDIDLACKLENQLRIDLNDHLQKISGLFDETSEAFLRDFLAEIDNKTALTKEIETNFGKFEYSFVPPVPGNWQIFSEDKELRENSIFNVVDDRRISEAKIIWNEAQKNFEVYLEDKEYQISLDLQSHYDFSDTEWERVDKTIFTRQIKNWNKESYYWLSFDYEGKPENFELSLMREVSEGKKGFRSINIEKLVVERGRGVNDSLIKKSYGKFFETDRETASLNLSFVSKNADPNVIRNLKIIRIIKPGIFFKLSNQNTKQFLLTPKVFFKRMSPVHLQVNVVGAKMSHLLVFNESYHDGWVLKIGNREIGKGRHIKANGFANGWIISPRDFDGKDSSELSIFFSPQDSFRMGVKISSVFFFGVLSSFFILIIFKKKKNV